MNEFLCYYIAGFIGCWCAGTINEFVESFFAFLRFKKSSVSESLENPFKIKWSALFFGIALFGVMCFLLVSSVSAAELQTTDSYSSTDLEQDERLNAIELRLEELGYQINEASDAIEAIISSEHLEEEQRLSISEKIELLVIGLSDLLNKTTDSITQDSVAYDIARIGQERIEAYVEFQKLASEELNDLTVSGNTILTDFNEDMTGKIDSVSATSIEEFNKTLLSTNTLLSYLFVLILLLLVVIIALFIGWIVHNITHKFVN